MVNGAYMRGLNYLTTSSMTHNDPPIAVMLVSSNAAYEFDGTHNYVSSVSAWELSSTSYQAVGEPNWNGRLTAQAVSSLEADGTSGVYWTFSSLEWPSMTDSDVVGAMVTFVSSVVEDGSDGVGSNELLFWHGNGFPQTPNGTLTLNPNATSGAAYVRNADN